MAVVPDFKNERSDTSIGFSPIFLQDRVVWQDFGRKGAVVVASVRTARSFPHVG